MYLFQPAPNQGSPTHHRSENATTKTDHIHFLFTFLRPFLTFSLSSSLALTSHLTHSFKAWKTFGKLFLGDQNWCFHCGFCGAKNLLVFILHYRDIATMIVSWVCGTVMLWSAVTVCLCNFSSENYYHLEECYLDMEFNLAKLMVLMIGSVYTHPCVC